MGSVRITKLAKNKTLRASCLALPNLLSFREMQGIQTKAIRPIRFLAASQLKQPTWT